MTKSLLTVFVASLFLSACAGTGGGALKSNPKKNLALIQASRKGDTNLVAMLIQNGADMNAVDNEGWTPYLAASVEGNWAVMKFLESHGAKTDPGF